MKRSLGICGNMMKVAYAGIIMAGLSPSLSFAAPAVTGASGALTQGGAITISGSGFGSHTMQIESIQSNIENGVAGQLFSKSGWTFSDWDDYGVLPTYATDSAHSGTKSLKCDMMAVDGQGMCGFAYDMPNVAAGQRFYATWWTKYRGASAGQWKLARISQNLTIVDGNQQLDMFNWFNVQQQNVMHPGAADQRTLWYGGLYPTGDNTWHRIELDYVAGSTGTANGVITVRVTKDNGTITSDTDSDVKTHPLAGASWNYFIFQNYIGNGITGEVDVWIDDAYIQYNTPARVELCTGTTWANRGKCEIQVPQSWGASSISALVNTGNFTSGTNAYLYVVDSTGTANNTGQLVKIGGSTPTPVPVPAPTLNSIRMQ